MGSTAGVVLSAMLWNERDMVVSEPCHASLAQGQTLGSVCHLAALLSGAGVVVPAHHITPVWRAKDA